MSGVVEWGVITWFVVVGVLLIGMAVVGSVLKRLPVTAALLYLGVGALMGPWGMGLLDADIVRHAATLERLSEIAVIVSLFTAGLKLRLPFRDQRWRIAILLATVAMTVTIGAVAALGLGMGLPLATAALLGAVLAPTDPVLASDVQVSGADDDERVRVGLTGEAGLNDGTAFPFVMLGLGLVGVHELGTGGWRWLLVDVGWAIAGGLGIGAACGTLVGRLVLYLRREHREAVGLDEFLALGLIALAYGLALAAHAYGFLAVFAAGLAVRRIEREHAEVGAPVDVAAAAELGEEHATRPDTAPAYMAQAVLAFNEQLERLGEFAVVIAVGALLAGVSASWIAIGFALALFAVVRPAATYATLAGVPLRPAERVVIGWFGVRGVGSIYYLTYAIGRVATPESLRQVADLTLVVVALSIVLHGISVTPAMRRFHGHTD